MAKCAVCGKGAHFGNNVSHSHRRSNRMWKSNIKRVSCKAVSYTHLVLDMIEQLIDEDSAIVSIYYGEDAKEDAANAIGEKITEAHPDVPL